LNPAVQHEQTWKSIKTPSETGTRRHSRSFEPCSTAAIYLSGRRARIQQRFRVEELEEKGSLTCGRGAATATRRREDSIGS
jgi:hypothetical protein